MDINNQEAVIFIGIPASGKTTFYNERYSRYVHVNMDTLHTRNKEKILISDCLRKGLSFVVDNTNPAIADREDYIQAARDNGYRVIGYYFKSSVTESLERNKMREGKAKVPDVAVKSVYKKIELPSYAEGFDELYYVNLNSDGFIVENWMEE